MLANTEQVYNARPAITFQLKGEAHETDRHGDCHALAGIFLLLGLGGQVVAPVTAAAQEEAVAKTNLKVGDVAPDFSLLSDKWEQVKLSDYRGKKNVILAFYVLAFTGG